MALCKGQCPQGWGQLLAVSTEDRLRRNGLRLGHFFLPKEHFRQTGQGGGKYVSMESGGIFASEKSLGSIEGGREGLDLVAFGVPDGIELEGAAGPRGRVLWGLLSLH